MLEPPAGELELDGGPAEETEEDEEKGADEETETEDELQLVEVVVEELAVEPLAR